MSTNDAAIRAADQPTDAPLLEHGAWRVLAEGSRAGFRVKKMGLYYVKGQFDELEGRVDFAPGSASPTGEVTIQAASVNTRMPPRDWHLRTADWLEVRTYPAIRIRADRVEPAGHGAFTTAATIEIRGVAKQVLLTLHAHHHEETPGLARVHLQGVIDRRAFGIKAMPPADWVVAPDVHIDAELLLERAG